MQDEINELQDESDESLRDRAVEFLPVGCWYTAEDLGNASGVELDEFVAQYGLKRRKV